MNSSVYCTHVWAILGFSQNGRESFTNLQTIGKAHGLIVRLGKLLSVGVNNAPL